MATHKNNDQFSTLGGKWTNFRRTLDTAPASDRISGERSATAPGAENFGQRPLTSSIVTLYLPGHYFGRSMATHKNNDQFSPLSGRWTSARNSLRSSRLDTACCSTQGFLEVTSPTPCFSSAQGHPKGRGAPKSGSGPCPTTQLHIHAKACG
jgi:hypothetical protein